MVQQVLNLVRSETERLSDAGGLPVERPADEAEARRLVRAMAAMALRAASCPQADLTALSDAAARCASHRFLERHCGGCQEYDLSNQCPACGEVSP